MELYNHAGAILIGDFPEAIIEVVTVLHRLAIPIESLVRGGGGETDTTQGLRRALAGYGWHKHNCTVKKFIDNVERESISHEIDHVRELPNGKIALEIEWNNKDPFFDRDLENFKRLHAESAISAGVIITRGKSLQNNIRSMVTKFANDHNVQSYDDLIAFDLEPISRQRANVNTRMKTQNLPFSEAWAEIFCSDKYGQATTHWRKLEDRVRRGVGNPCPLLLIGIPDTVITSP